MVVHVHHLFLVLISQCIVPTHQRPNQIYCIGIETAGNHHGAHGVNPFDIVLRSNISIAYGNHGRKGPIEGCDVLVNDRVIFYADLSDPTLLRLVYLRRTYEPEETSHPMGNENDLRTHLDEGYEQIHPVSYYIFFKLIE